MPKYKHEYTLRPSLQEALRQPREAPKPKRSAFVRFSGDDFDRFIEEKGHRMLWQQAVQCPCEINTQTDQPNPFCEICGGGGWEYFDPRIIKGLITEVSGEYQLFPGSGQQRGYAIVEKFGEWYSGEAILTVRPEHPVGFRDRLTMLDAAIEFSEIIRRDSEHGTMAPLRYRIVPRLIELFDIETQKNVIVTERVIHLRVWSYTTESFRLLREHADYDVYPDGTLDFAKGIARGTAPEVGDKYAIKYTINPPWVVWDLKPQYFRHSQNKDEPDEEDLVVLPRSLGIAIDFLVKPQEE